MNNKMSTSILTKILIILITVVVILQIVHLILLYQLEWVKAESYARLKGQGYLNFKQLDMDKYRVMKKVRNSHVLDVSGHYHIINNLLNNLKSYENQVDYDQLGNQQESRSNDLTLITQCSASRLYYIDDLLHAYHGPVSLSIFTLSRDIPNLMNVLILLRKCVPLFQEYVKVHLIYPLTSDSYSVRMSDIDPHNLSCSTLSHRLAALKKHKDEFKLYGEDDGVAYPVNLLRNVARQNADTTYILVLDIDLIPSKSLRKDFLQFINRNKETVKLSDNTVINFNDQIVFVLPTYEIDLNVGNNLANIYGEDSDEQMNKININDDDMKDKMNDVHLGMNLGNIVGKNFGTSFIPTNKTTLLTLIKKHLIRPFYYELCFKCQKTTDYERWQSIDDHLNVAYEVAWKDPYEPFYIAMNVDTLPYYDQRFKQYGFNRISQVCNLHIVGYRFLVLSNHFLVHKGFKMQDKFHDGKEAELEQNRLLFRQFKNEIKIKYPNSPRRCY